MRSRRLRFAAVGVVNTGIDLGLFALLHGPLGLALANLVSTGAGMATSFVANGRFTFGRDRLDAGQALRFVATTGTVLWVVQPTLIAELSAPTGVLGAKVLATGTCVVGNYLLCRHVVWRDVRTGRRPSGRDAAPSGARR
ncbi:GtrA family protein [Nocardioides sp. MAHUQ-72]|uniref:GtrA family protein n=1 Tax=unclassified Nocardioides TaxID=2615069 RepID=UPI00362130F2